MTNEEAIKLLSNRYMVVSECIDSNNAIKDNIALDMAISALEKQIEKPVEVYSDGDADGYPVWEEHCPSCGYDFDGTTPNFCQDCGQRLLFEEESE